MKEKWLKIKGEVTESGCAVWWIYATDGVEYWTVDGPFDSEGAATARLSEIEEEGP